MRAKIREGIGPNRGNQDFGVMIDDLNPVLCGWGNYFRNPERLLQVARGRAPRH